MRRSDFFLYKQLTRLTLIYNAFFRLKVMVQVEQIVVGLIQSVLEKELMGESVTSANGN